MAGGSHQDGDKDLRKVLALAGPLVALVTWGLYKCCRRAIAPVEEEPAAAGDEAPSVKLRIVDGLSAGLVFEFSAGDVVTVGRRVENRVVLSDTGISGMHCEIAYSVPEGAWMLADLGSLNGTFLNRVLIASDQRTKSEHRHLKSEDRIQIGEATTIEVVCTPSWQPEEQKSPSDIAQVLLTLLDQKPLDSEITDSITPFAYAPCRMTGCQIQKTGARARASGVCEDTFAAHLPLAGALHCALCLCDGHCGADTANAVQDALPAVLADSLAAAAAAQAPTLDSALTEAFLALDAGLVGRDGATMSLLLLNAEPEGAADNNGGSSGGGGGAVSIQAANVGDSAIVCANFQQMMKMHLTDNHRVAAPAEAERLKDAGSQLTHKGTRLMGLNLSRSLGDRALKEMNSGYAWSH